MEKRLHKPISDAVRLITKKLTACRKSEIANIIIIKVEVEGIR